MLKGNSENPHQIPLVGWALEMLKAMPQDREFVFYDKARRKRRSVDDNGFLKGLGEWRDKTGRPITVHGFRTSFRTWAAEQTNFPWEVCEAALSHTVGNEVSVAYQRGTLFQKRRKLMQAWDRFCGSMPSNNVVPIRMAAAG
jgi:integrase